MKSVKILSAVVLGVVGLSGIGFAAETTTTVGATANLVAPPTVTPTDPAFGTLGLVDVSTTATSIVLNTDGTETTASAARVTVSSGTGGQIVVESNGTPALTAIAADAGGGSFTLTDGAAGTMTGHIGISATLGASEGTLDGDVTGTVAAGDATFYVGADVTVGVAQAAGSYTTDTPQTITITYS